MAAEDNTLIGGGNKLAIFRTAVESGVVVLKSADGTTNATDYSDAAIVLELLEETKPDIKSPLADLTLTQYQDNPAFLAFCKQAAWIPNTGTDASEISEIVLENGTKLYGSAAATGAPTYVAISFGAKRPAANTRKMGAYYGTFENTLGSTTQKSKTVSAPGIKLVGKKAEADIALAAFLPTSTFSGTPVLTIPEGISFEQTFLALV